MSTPQFVLQIMYPKLVNGFDTSIKMEVVGVQMTKEDVAVVDSGLARLFPANMSGKFYGSFLQDTDDDILRVVYGQQNLWLQFVQTVTVSKFGNIDKPYEIGTHFESSCMSNPTVIIKFLLTWTMKVRAAKLK
jgi:hypothetical protein